MTTMTTANELLGTLEAWAGYVERLVTAEGVARLR
jgi:hypothetical protein